MTHTRVQTDRQAWKSSTPRDTVPLSQDEVTEFTRSLTLASLVKLLDVPLEEDMMSWNVGTCRIPLAVLGLMMVLLAGGLVSTGSAPSPQ